MGWDLNSIPFFIIFADVENSYEYKLIEYIYEFLLKNRLKQFGTKYPASIAPMFADGNHSGIIYYIPFDPHVLVHMIRKLYFYNNINYLGVNSMELSNDLNRFLTDKSDIEIIILAIEFFSNSQRNKHVVFYLNSIEAYPLSHDEKVNTHVREYYFMFNYMKIVNITARGGEFIPHKGKKGIPFFACEF